MDDLTPRAARITLLVLDIDGVLTDGRVYVSPEGEALKAFSLRDGHGIVLAQEAGIEVAFLSRSVSPIAQRRAEKLKIEHIIEGCLDKGTALRDLAAHLGRAAEEVAFMGDDVIDIDAMRWAGVAACPADAEPEVREIADLITERPGGRGAVREFIRALLLARGASTTGA